MTGSMSRLLAMNRRLTRDLEYYVQTSDLLQVQLEDKEDQIKELAKQNRALEERNRALVEQIKVFMSGDWNCDLGVANVA